MFAGSRATSLGVLEGRATYVLYRVWIGLAWPGRKRVHVRIYLVHTATMPRPRCLVILLPQGGGRNFCFGEMHDWSAGSSIVYDPGLARGCRCNVSRLVTDSVSSADVGSTRCVW